jgi:hypothetical protein
LAEDLVVPDFKVAVPEVQGVAAVTTVAAEQQLQVKALTVHLVPEHLLQTAVVVPVVVPVVKVTLVREIQVVGVMVALGHLRLFQVRQ